MERQIKFLQEIGSHLPMLFDENMLGLWRLSLNNGLITIYGKSYISTIFGEDLPFLEMSWEKYLREYCRAEDRDAILEAIASSSLSREPYRNRHRVWNARKRSWLWHYSFGSVIESPEGGLSFYGYSRDISDTILMEHAYESLHLSEQNTMAILDVTPLANTLWDENLKMIDCNLEAVKMFGVGSKAEYINSHMALLPQFQPDGSESVEKLLGAIARAFVSGREVFEYVFNSKSGADIPANITLIRIKLGDVVRVAGYAMDLRELKASIAEMERAHDELRDALIKAEESTKAKSEFLSNMSHEIRTPMNAIIGMADIARGTDDVGKMQYCLSKIDDASNHLLGVINDILDMSKIEAGKFELSETDFELEKMLARITSVINFRVDQKNQNFIIKVSPDVPETIVADQQRLAQVVTNLLSNAVKFTPEGGKISLYVDRPDERDGVCTLRFRVADNGIGLTEEQIGKLFQSFVQADGTITRRFGGTGLGLVISKNIVEAMGGDISVNSEQGKGSEFVFTIKAKTGEPLHERALSSDVDWSKIKLLVVDDDPDIREYFEQIASDVGVVCRTVPDGFTACRAIEEDEKYDLIFVDWKMPGMDGIELTRRIRQIYDENIVVIMISATEWSQISDRAKEAGVDSFVPKPLLPSVIIDCVNKYFDKVGPQKPAPTVEVASNRDIFKGSKIMLVDDIDINREIIIDLLEETGVEIASAANGKIACELFEAEPDAFDLILMDVHMPVMDGYEATCHIRATQHARSASIPIIAMTANVFREDIEKCLSVGMNEHVGKPVDIDEIILKMKKYLDS